MNEVWAIILAAGSSTRMKKQKLLLPFNGKNIIETVIENAVHAVESNIMVVLGSNKEEILEKIKHSPVSYCINENYRNGMLSSAICGFHALPGTAKAALIFLGDQPQIPSSIALNVLEAWKRSVKGIIVPVYRGRRGHPVLIETRFIPEIENLDQNRGLKQLMEKFPEEIFEINCISPEILRDIDTPEEYKLEINKL